MLIAEELLLLLLDDESGKLVVDATTAADPVLAGAVLVDLALGGFVDVAAAGEPVKEGRIVIRRPGPTGDPLLDEALATATAAAGKKPATLIPKVAKGLRAAVSQRLVDRGIVRSERAKVLGIFPTSRWPEADPRPEAQARERLAAVLLSENPPDVPTAALISLLLTANALPKVIRTDRTGAPVDTKALIARAKQVADSDWASAAARRAVKDLQAAIGIAVMVPTTVVITS